MSWWHLFNWEIQSVGEPVQRFHPHNAFLLVAYQVHVDYKYHGARTVYFPVGNYGLFVNSPGMAHQQALDFYNKMVQRVKRDCR